MCSLILKTGKLSQETRAVAMLAMSQADSAVSDEMVSAQCISNMSRALLEQMHDSAAYGRHVLVSVGRRGIVWVTMDSFGFTSSRAVDAIPLPTHKKAAHTSGAGDAFCSGFLCSLADKTIDNNNRLTSVYAAIKCGIDAAHKHIVNN